MKPAHHVVLEFARADESGDPFAFRRGTQDYLLRGEGGTFQSTTLRWDDAFQADLDALRRPGRSPERVQRFGEALREFVAPAGWPGREAAIAGALDKGQRVIVTLRSAAAELYALPWGLLTLRSTGQHLGELPEVLLRYEWPGTASAPAVLEQTREAGRVLVAWSAGGRRVPSEDHVAAIEAACEAGGVDFDRARDVLPHVSLERLDEALSAAAGPEERPIGVLHLLCHGGAIGDSYGLVFDGRDGPVTVDAARLRQVISPYAGMLRLVVISACDGGNPGEAGSTLGSVAQTLHRSRVCSVVASRQPLSVPGSVTLTQALYGALVGEGASLEDSFLSARRQLSRDASQLDWAAIQLYSRAADGDDTRPLCQGKETLSPQEVDDAVAAALGARLHEQQRGRLLRGLPEGLVRSLPLHNSAVDQLRSDVLELAQRPEVDGLDGPPIAVWLANAAQLARPHADVLVELANVMAGTEGPLLPDVGATDPPRPRPRWLAPAIGGGLGMVALLAAALLMGGRAPLDLDAIADPLGRLPPTPEARAIFADGLAALARIETEKEAAIAAVHQAANTLVQTSACRRKRAQCVAPGHEANGQWIEGEIIDDSYLAGEVLWAAACRAGHASSCNLVGYMHDIRRKDDETASAFYGRGCDLGKWLSCSNLGDTLKQAKGLSKLEKAWRALHAQPSRTPAEEAEYQRLGVARQGWSPVREAYARACTNGEMPGCRRLGGLYLDGYGVDQDVRRGVALIRETIRKDKSPKKARAQLEEAVTRLRLEGAAPAWLLPEDASINAHLNLRWLAAAGMLSRIEDAAKRAPEAARLVKAWREGFAFDPFVDVAGYTLSTLMEEGSTTLLIGTAGVQKKRGPACFRELADFREANGLAAGQAECRGQPSGVVSDCPGGFTQEKVWGVFGGLAAVDDVLEAACEDEQGPLIAPPPPLHREAAGWVSVAAHAAPATAAAWLRWALGDAVTELTPSLERLRGLQVVMRAVAPDLHFEIRWSPRPGAKAKREAQYSLADIHQRLIAASLPHLEFALGHPDQLTLYVTAPPEAINALFARLAAPDVNAANIEDRLRSLMQR